MVSMGWYAVGDTAAYCGTHPGPVLVRTRARPRPDPDQTQARSVLESADV